MSGIEVVGLVLGAIPLVISALEHYFEGISTIKRFECYEKELSALVTTLDTEGCMLENTCRLLLSDLVPRSQIDAIMSDPVGAFEHNPDLQRRVEKRLWSSYGPFLATIKDIKDALKEMCDRLGLGEDGKIRWLQNGKRTFKRSFSRQLKKATFTLSKASYDDLLKRIADGNSHLAILTHQTTYLEPILRDHSQGRYHDLVRETLKSVYRALGHGLAKNCHSSTHAVSLALEARPADISPNDSDMAIIQGLSIHLGCAIHNDENASETALLCKEVVLKQIASSTILSAPTAPISMPSWSMFLQRQQLAPNLHMGIAAQSSTRTATGTTTETTTSVGRPAIQLSIGANKEDIDLCKALSSTSDTMQIDYYGMVLDVEKQREYGVYPLTDNRHSLPWSTTSLRQALVEKQLIWKPCGRGKEKEDAAAPCITPVDRYALAFAISSSILHLQGTPWLDGCTLSSENILFPNKYSPPGSSAGSMPIYTEAFVAASISPDPSLNVISGIAARKEGTGLQSDMPFVCLGVLLIELILGEELSIQSEGELDELDVCIAASKSLEMVRIRGGIGYLEVVQWCLDQCHRRMDPENEGCLTDIEKYVAGRLENEYQNAKG